MRDTKDLTTDKPGPAQRHQFGKIALGLWAIAITFVPVDMAYATGRALTFSRDLLTITTVSASLATLLWYLDRNLVAHLLNWRIGIEYGFKNGYHLGYRNGRGACKRSSCSGEHLADVILIEPMRHPDDRRAVPEMRRNGHHGN